MLSLLPHKHQLFHFPYCQILERRQQDVAYKLTLVLIETGLFSNKAENRPVYVQYDIAHDTIV